jgi:hypothetical protein
MLTKENEEKLQRWRSGLCNAIDTLDRTAILPESEAERPKVRRKLLSLIEAIDRWQRDGNIPAADSAEWDAFLDSNYTVLEMALLWQQEKKERAAS